jgi:hypothetical protein
MTQRLKAPRNVANPCSELAKLGVETREVLP